MNPKKSKEGNELSVSSSDNEWNWEYEYELQPQDVYDYDLYYDKAGPLCKVVWVRDGKEYQKEYSSREEALEKQKSLLMRKLPAIIKSC